MPIQIDPGVVQTEQQIAKTKTNLAEQEKQIADTQKQLTEAKTNLSVKVTAPKLTRAQIKGMSRLQKAQLKGQVGLTDIQRKKSLAEVKSKESTFLTEKQKFETEAAKVRSDIKTVESQIGAYRGEVQRANEEEARWNYVKKLIDRDREWIVAIYGSPAEKRILKLLRNNLGYQSPSEIKAGVYPSGFLENLKRTQEVKDWMSNVKDLKLPQSEINFTISQQYGARFNPGPMTEKITKIPQTVITSGTSSATFTNTPELKGNIQLGDSIRQAAYDAGKTTITVKNIPTSFATLPKGTQTYTQQAFKIPTGPSAPNLQLQQGVVVSTGMPNVPRTETIQGLGLGQTTTSTKPSFFKWLFSKPPQQHVADYLIRKNIDITAGPRIGNVPINPLGFIGDIERAKIKEGKTSSIAFFGSKLVEGVATPIADTADFVLEKVGKPIIKAIGPSPQERLADFLKSKDIGAEELKKTVVLTPIVDIVEAKKREENIEKLAKIQYNLLGKSAAKINEIQTEAQNLGSTPLTIEINKLADQFNEPGKTDEEKLEIYNKYQTIFDKNSEAIKKEQEIIAKKEELFNEQERQLKKIKDSGFSIKQDDKGNITFKNKYISDKEFKNLRPGWQGKKLAESGISFFNRKFVKGVEMAFTDLFAGAPTIIERKPFDQINYNDPKYRIKPIEILSTIAGGPFAYGKGPGNPVIKSDFLSFSPKLAGKGVGVGADIGTYFVPGVGAAKLFGPTVEKTLRGELKQFAKEEPLEVGLAIGTGVLKIATTGAKFFKTPVKRIGVRPPEKSILKSVPAQKAFKKQSVAIQQIASEPGKKGKAVFVMKTTVPGQPYVDLTKFQQTFYKIPAKGPLKGGTVFAKLEPKLPFMKSKLIPVSGFAPTRTYLTGTLTPLKISKSGSTTGTIVRYRVGKGSKLVDYAEFSFKGKGKPITIHTFKKLRPFEKEQVKRLAQSYYDDILKDTTSQSKRLFASTGTSKITPITKARTIRKIDVKLTTKKPIVDFTAQKIKTPINVKFDVYAGKARQAKLSSIAKLEAELPNGVKLLTGKSVVRETTRIGANVPRVTTGARLNEIQEFILYKGPKGKEFIAPADAGIGEGFIKIKNIKIPNAALKSSKGTKVATNLKVLSQAQDDLVKVVTKSQKTGKLIQISKTQKDLLSKIHGAVTSAEAAISTTLIAAPIPKLVVKPSVIPLIGIAGAVKATQKPSVKLIQSPIVKTIQKPIEKTQVIEKFNIAQAEVTKTVQKPGTGTVTVQKPAIEKPIITKPGVIIPPSTKPPEEILKPIPPIKLFIPTEKIKKKRKKNKAKLEPGYNVKIKPIKKRNYIKANINPITKKQALDLGSNITDTSLGATFKIEKAGAKAQKPVVPITKGYFEKTRKKYRDFQYKKKKKKPTPNKWIEKRNRRLDTIGEIKKVTTLAAIAKLKKSAKSKKRNTSSRSSGVFSIKSPKIKTNIKFI